MLQPVHDLAEFNDSFEQMRTKVLERLVQGTSLCEVLSIIASSIEAQRPGMLCSILTLEAGQRLRHGAAPSLPQFYNEAIDGLAIGPRVGSCGAAAFTARPVIVEDIQNHPNWKDFRALTARAALASCWSMPILNKDGRVLGTFAIYQRKPSSPSKADLRLVEATVSLVALAIEHIELREEMVRQQADLQSLLANLRESEERFRFLADFAPVMIWLDGPDGEGVYYNKIWLDFTGRTLEQELGFGWHEVLHRDDREGFETAYRQARESRTALTTEYRMLRHDGSYRWVIDTGVPRFDSAGTFLGFVGTSLDITERKRRERLLRAAAEGITMLRGPAFFQQLVTELGTTLEVDVALVGMFDRGGNRIQTHALYMRGELVANVQYDLAGSACESVLRSDACVYADSIQALFPNDTMLREMDLQSYCGTVVRNAFSGDLGVLVVCHSQVMDSPDEYLALVKVFGRYASNELERQSHEADLLLAAQSFETQQEGIMIADADGTIVRVNKAFTEITGFPAEEVIGQKPNVLRSGRHDEAFYRQFWQTLSMTGRWQGEIWNRRKNGEIFPEWLSVTAVRDGSGAITRYVGTMFDLTERKQAEAEIARLAYFDDLTDLPNRRLLVGRIEQALALANRSGFFGAVMFVDLDHFKNLNDGLGHSSGDVLLRQVAQRLKEQLRTEDTVARLGGDEFVILLANLGSSTVMAATQARMVAEKVREVLNEDYDLGSCRHEITASIGVALFPEDNEDVQELLKRADTAMYRAKADGRNCVRFYESGMQASAEARLAMDRDLRVALRNGGQLFLMFQPKFDADGRIIGAEALLRWQHPVRGLVGPMEFVPVAEESGLIVPIGEQVLAEACRRFASVPPWMRESMTVAVNVSARQLQQADFVERVQGIVTQSGLEPSRLTIELTEGMVVQNLDDTIVKMTALKRFGVRFSIDDFGTGYSSLAYLKRLPIDELKIDRSFTVDVTVDPDDAALVETILSVARHFKLHVVAEGVETEEQLRFLQDRNCAGYQGYYLSRPVSFEDLLTIVQRRG